MAKHVGFFSFVAAVVFFSISAPVKADTVHMTLTGVSGEVQGGVYTSPYYATINGTQNVLIVCDDFVHEVYIGESWWATTSTFSDLSQVRFQQGTNAQTLQLYEEAAWLFDQLFMPANTSHMGDISFAMWAVFSPTQTEANSGWTSGAASWLSAAQSQTFTPGEFSDIEILTPTTSDANSPQENLIRTAVPEPSTFLLLGAGLMALMVLARSKKAGAFASA
jgi:hypothetical protein